MNRTIKLSVFTCILTSLILTGCKDSDDGIGAGSDDNYGLKITAEVEDGNDYNHLIDRVRAIMYRGGETIIIADCEFKNGGFELKLPEEVNSNRLSGFDDFFENLDFDNSSVSNPSAMLNEIILVAFKNGKKVGTFSSTNGTPTLKTYAEFWYVDADVTIKDSYEGDNHNYTMDLLLKKGWNEVFYEESSSGFTHTTSLKEPSDLKWQLDFTGDGGISGNKIIAIVENGNNYNNYVDEVWGIMASDYYEAAKTKYSNGGFTIELPSSITGNYLWNILELFDYEYYDNFTISDRSVSCGVIYFLGVDDYGYFLGEFYQLKETYSSNSESIVYGYYLYVNKDVTIKGSYSETDYGTNYEEIINLSLKKGWNAVFISLEYSYNNMGNDTETFSFTTTNPGGLKWYFDYGWKSTTYADEEGFPLKLSNSTVRNFSFGRK
ncbi:MAG: hypothetical protein FWH18_12195 [Marinilabiliaceae bacterium]|nr:hypothetical protein [Marinilabiliaceae bacterium]